MPRHVQLRPVRQDEVDALGGLKLRASLAYGDHVEALRDLPEARQLASELVPHSIVAELDGAAAGFITVTIGGAQTAEIEELFVEPRLWGSGVGRALVEDALRRSAAAGASVVTVVANRRAQGFYERCGFRVTREVMTLFEPALLMVQHLAGSTQS